MKHLGRYNAYRFSSKEIHEAGGMADAGRIFARCMASCVIVLTKPQTNKTALTTLTGAASEKFPSAWTLINTATWHPKSFRHTRTLSHTHSVLFCYLAIAGLDAPFVELVRACELWSTAYASSMASTSQPAAAAMYASC